MLAIRIAWLKDVTDSITTNVLPRMFNVCQLITSDCEAHWLAKVARHNSE